MLDEDETTEEVDEADEVEICTEELIVAVEIECVVVEGTVVWELDELLNFKLLDCAIEVKIDVDSILKLLTVTEVELFDYPNQHRE